MKLNSTFRSSCLKSAWVDRILEASESLESKLIERMILAWQQDEPLSAETLLEEVGCSGDSELAIRLAYEEFCARREAGRTVDVGEFYERFPQWKSQLAVLFECEELLEPPRFPQPGEDFDQYHLVSELGRGAAGRVFLATQPRLGERPVVLKLTRCDGAEHLSLARLQHPGIMPLYSVRHFEQRNLRVLCMPYVGGTDLEKLLASLSDIPVRRRSGRHVVAAINNAAEEIPTPVCSRQPSLRFLERASYVQVVCWIGSCLAEALEYAHRRDLLHLDLKPSNVLLAADGQPMLLDFHLACPPVQKGSSGALNFGGTPGYMSPEQQLAVEMLLSGRRVPVAVDHRSDIYSLGLLLFQAFTDRLPADSTRWGTSVRHYNRQVPREVDAIIRRCLSPDPERRFSDAGQLASCLRRPVLDHTQPHRLSPRNAFPWVASIAIPLLITALTSSLVFNRTLYQKLAETNQKLERVEELNREQRRSLQYARCASEFRAVVEQLNAIEADEEISTDQLREIERNCDKIWSARHKVLAAASSSLEPTSVTQIKDDLMTIVQTWATLHVRLAESDRRIQAQRNAKAVLARAEAELQSAAGLH